jgi:hypothetical protein
MLLFRGEKREERREKRARTVKVQGREKLK